MSPEFPFELRELNLWDVLMQSPDNLKVCFFNEVDMKRPNHTYLISLHPRSLHTAPIN